MVLLSPDQRSNFFFLVQTLDNETAVRLSGENPDYGIQALFEAIENKRYPSWTVYVVRVIPLVSSIQ